jgi:3-phosphoshikimate 1-carboxyvinyltransferase
LNALVGPCRSLSGEITAPPSKANTHRALIAALFSRGVTELINPLQCDDTNATVNAVTSLGAKVSREASNWSVSGNGMLSVPQCPIECGESGVTLRFMIPIVSLVGERVVLSANRNLMRRPLNPLTEALKQLRVSVIIEDDKVLVEGSPEGGIVSIRGDVSSQFVSGLLFAGSLMDRGLDLELTTPLESCNYVRLTLEIMKQHGIKVESNREMTRIGITPGQRYSATRHFIHGDYSSAAFTLAAAAVTRSTVLVRDLQQSQVEPDAIILQILSRMGATTGFLGNGVALEGGRLKGISVNIQDSPDLGPILAVLGSYATGETRITGAARLRFKESDRLATITSELDALGARVTETEDGFSIRGPSDLQGGVVQSHRDHRIAMALTVAALGASGDVIIKDSECVSKSYPNFFGDLRSLGVEIIEQ